MNQEIIDKARARVSNALGEKLASKASDAFCLAFGVPQFAVTALEAVSESVRPQPVVLEFSQQPEISEQINSAVDELRNTKAWASLRKALGQIELPSGQRGTTELMESGRSEPELLPVHASRLLRHVKVTSLRDNFLKIAGSITERVERGSHTFSRPQTESLGTVQPSRSVTQVCWLNRTVRSFSQPHVLAEVAADDSIERIDLTRRLTPEILVSGVTVGTPTFRKKFKRTGKGIIVAVIDTEAALNHPALKGRIVHKENYTNELWGNASSHGTAVAGIVGSNDGTFTGMAPEATIYNYKVLASNPALTGDDFDGSLAIERALEDGAHIANCSWGAGPAGNGTSREARACDEAWALGLTIVKSAGNLGSGASTLTSPADADGVIVVGATEREGRTVQFYSSRGPAGSKVRPHLLAPGGIVEDVGITSCLVGGGFGDCGAGTSFAAPHVSGMLALLLERDPSLRPNQLRDILLNACTILAGADENTQGKGLVSLGSI
jgi:serine protease AprX